MPSIRFSSRAFQRLCLAALLAAAALPCAPARAATYTWLGNSGNSWSNGANWQGGMAPPSDLLNTDLLFGNSGGPYPSITAAYSIHSLTFTSNANAFTFDTGPLTLGAGGFIQNAANAETFGAPVVLGAAQTWTLASGAGALTFGGGVNTPGGGTAYALTINAATTTGSGNVINGNITGGGSLTKTGAGTLTLTGACTYTGTTSVNAGTLAVGTSGSFSGDSISVGAGAALALNGTGSIKNSANGSDTLYLDGTNASPARLTIADSSTFSRSFFFVGNSGTGIITQSGGTVAVGGGPFELGIGGSGIYNLGGTGILSASKINVGLNGNGIFNQTGGTFTINGGPVDFGRSGEGTYNLGGGTLTAGTVGTLGGSKSTFNFNGGILQAGMSNADFFSGLTTANVQVGGAKIDTNGYNVTVAQNLVHDTTANAAATDGGLTKLGAGTLTLTGSNTFTGPVVVNAGTLQMGNAQALGVLPTVQVANAPGAVLSLGDFNQTVFSLAGGGVAGGEIDLGSHTLTVNGNGINTIFAGVVSGSGGLVKTGTDTQGLTGTNTYTGGTNLQNGMLAVGGSQPLGSGGTLTFGGGTLLATADALVTNNIVTPAGGAVVMAAAPGTTLTYHGHSAQFDSRQGTAFVFGGTGQTGTVNFTLDQFSVTFLPSGTNLQAFVNGGTLQTNVNVGSSALTLSFSDVHLVVGTTLDLANQAPQVLNLYGTGTVTTSLAGSSNLLSVSGGEFAGRLTGPISLAVVNPYNQGTTTGTLILEGANTFTGTATANAGQLQLSNDQALQNATAVLDLSNGLVFSAGIGTFKLGGLSGSGNQTLVDTGGEAVYLSAGGNGADTVYSGTLSGAGGLNKVGTGTLTLSGSNIYTGSTTVAEGTLAAVVPASLAGYDTAGRVVVNSGGTLAVRYGGTGQWQNADAATLLANATFNASSTLAIDTGDAPAAVAYYGGIGGSLGLAKVGEGTLVLAGTNNYTGSTTISAGTLQIGNGSIGTLAAGTVFDNAALVFNRADGLTVANTINGTGSVATIGKGTLTLTGNSTYTGGTTVSAGRLVELNTGNALGAGTVAINGSTTLELRNTATDGTAMRQAGGTTFTGLGTLQKTGAGTVYLGGNGGNVTVSLSQGALIDVQAGTLAGSSYNQGFFTNNQAGLNIAAGATFDAVEGAVQIDALTGAGALKGGYLNGSTLLGSLTVGVANGSATFAGSIQDHDAAGSRLTLTKTGTGTQILAGTNTYTGATMVNGGTLQLDNNPSAATPTAGKLAGTSGLTVNTGGTLLLSGSAAVSDRLNNAAAVTVANGGRFSTGGLSEGSAAAGATAGLGALTLTGGVTLDSGVGANGSTLLAASGVVTGSGHDLHLGLDRYAAGGLGGGGQRPAALRDGPSVHGGAVGAVQLLRRRGHAPWQRRAGTGLPRVYRTGTRARARDLDRRRIAAGRGGSGAALPAGALHWANAPVSREQSPQALSFVMTWESLPGSAVCSTTGRE